MKSYNKTDILKYINQRKDFITGRSLEIGLLVDRKMLHVMAYLMPYNDVAYLFMKKRKNIQILKFDDSGVFK